MRTIGPVTAYPFDCAMHGAVNITTRRWGYICFKPLTRAYGSWWPWYFYVSPNATPWGATFIIGRAHSRTEKRMAALRRVLWGHGYTTEEHDPQEADSYTQTYVGHLPSPEPSK